MHAAQFGASLAPQDAFSPPVLFTTQITCVTSTQVQILTHLERAYILYIHTRMHARTHARTHARSAI